MKNVGVIFGGVSCEHDVSIVTALQLLENIDKLKYNVIPIYIHSDGKWYTGDKLLDAKIYKDFDAKSSGLLECFIAPNSDGLVIQKRFAF